MMTMTREEHFLARMSIAKKGLERMREMIDYGWTQHEMKRFDERTGGVTGYSLEAACIDAAKEVWDRMSEGERMDAFPVFHGASWRDLNSMMGAEVRDAVVLTGQISPWWFGNDWMGVYNDTTGRTKEDVIAVLDKAVSRISDRMEEDWLHE